MPKILVTGFDPFGGESVNPSSMAVMRLNGRTYGNYEVVCREIPAVYGKSSKMLAAMIDEIKPAAVLSVGQAGSASAIRVERLAKNLDDARIKDNDGNQPEDRPIDPEGPAAYWATIPTRPIAAAINKAGIPAILSYSAGTFICNHVFYAASHHAAINNLPIKVGFIHVPYIPEQVTNKPNMPSMSLDDITKSIDTTLGVIAQDLQANA